jgi:hypothetical protein
MGEEWARRAERRTAEGRAGGGGGGAGAVGGEEGGGEEGGGEGEGGGGGDGGGEVGGGGGRSGGVVRMSSMLTVRNFLRRLEEQRSLILNALLGRISMTVAFSKVGSNFLLAEGAFLMRTKTVSLIRGR